MITAENVSMVYSTRSGPHVVLDKVNLRIGKGERVGILGRNGSGKSTLIRLVGGAEQPSSGTIERRMSVSWPLAFGGGFNANLTGFDNLRFVCRVYGVDYGSVIPFVEDFTELGVYLREPVLHYSEGMRARLAFALSLAIEFDCYLVDEVISVGDSRFHEKCNLELFEKRRDRAFILVSHSAETIRAHCDRAAVLISGKLRSFDNVDEAYAYYESNGEQDGTAGRGAGPSRVKEAIDLDSPDLEWVSAAPLDSSHQAPLDSLGRVLRIDGTYYRAVYNEKVAFAGELIGKGVLDALADNLLVPRQHPEIISHRKYGMLMRSESAKWPVRTVKFPLNAVRCAAGVWLAINRMLLPHGYALRDGHYGNFALFGNCVPKWVDVGSIAPLAPMAGVEDFLSRLIYPLVILSRVPELLAERHRVLQEGGVPRQEARQILVRAGADRFTAQENACLWDAPSLPRAQVLECLSELVKGLAFEWPRTVWSKYRTKGLERLRDPEHIQSTDPVRDRTISELVRRLASREILDVGANKGYHACMFAHYGADVLAIDTDEASVNECYQWLQDKPRLRVCCSVDDFETTQHAADTVVAVSLTQYLTLTSGLTFDQFADRCGQLARRHLVTEFMPNGLGAVVPSPDPLPAWYTLERFLDSLGRRFAKVAVVPWESERAAPLVSRTLVHCSEPRV